MDNNSSSSSAPLAWHDFFERTRHPSAVDCVKCIKNFIISCLNKAPDPEKVLLSTGLTSMEEAFRAHMLCAGCSEEKLESSAKKELQKIILYKAPRDKLMDESRP